MNKLKKTVLISTVAGLAAISMSAEALNFAYSPTQKQIRRGAPEHISAVLHGCNDNTLNNVCNFGFISPGGSYGIFHPTYNGKVYLTNIRAKFAGLKHVVMLSNESCKGLPGDGHNFQDQTIKMTWNANKGELVCHSINH